MVKKERGPLEGSRFLFRAQASVLNGADTISNLEYSEDDGGGHVQYIVGGRYLMEVQLECLLLESFQTLEDRGSLELA